ncbi:putative metal-binding motif-containing protein, partial [Corallococcus exercitus]
MKRLLLLLPLWALAGCKDPQDGVKVTVTYEGFVPACVRVKAQNGDSGDTRSTEVPVKDYGTTGSAKSPVVVGIRVPDGWGPVLTVTAEGLERAPDNSACGGKLVDTRSQGLRIEKGSADKGTPQELALVLSAVDADNDGYVTKSNGNGTDCDDVGAAGALVNPSAMELCNDRDDNCDGNRDEGLGLGDACIADNGCASVKACGPSNAVVCSTPPAQQGLIDEDKDGHGNMGAPVTVCTTGAFPSNRLPTSAPNDDCDDTNPNVKPGVTELCNGIDDNCVNGKDEGFMVGTTCTDGKQCADSTYQCNAVGTGTYCMSPDAGTWYPDDDNDNHGRADAGIVSCPQPVAGYILTGRDCDDGNPFIHGDAPELCDSQDNNCNGATDENSVCPSGAPNWDMRVVGDDSDRTWFGVSTYGDGGVWIVGSDGGRAVKEPSLAAFAQLQGACTTGDTPQVLPSVWADPSGTAYIGRNEGQLIVQRPDSGDCLPRVDVSGAATAVTRGLMGFVTDGGVNILGVGQKGTSNDGFTLQWDGGTAPVTATNRKDTVLSGVHGRSEGLLFSVGVDNSAKSVIFRYVPNTDPPDDWVKETGVPNVGALTAVHVVTSKLAYAVSASGKLLRWNGSTWTVIPSTPAGNYTGVLAFGTNSIYIATDEGTVLRYNGSAWSTEAAASSKYGIAGTSPDNIWVVGRFGQVTHYPSWPAAPPP